MNHLDRNRMARLYTCMANWPWPNRSRTIGPAELSEFFHNMEGLQTNFLDCVMAISRCDDESQDPDADLDVLEHELRRLAQHIP